MSRYIDADALKRRVGELIVPEWVRTLIRTWLESAPTVDAVHVARCGECKRRYKPLDDDVRNEIYCEFMGSTMRKDDFCSRGCADGEQKDDSRFAPNSAYNTHNVFRADGERKDGAE